jgi:Fur family ferric uptake transcriptional regulator
MGSLDADFEQDREKLAEYLVRNGLKHTRQREAILHTFLVAEGHITSEDLCERVREVHPEIGAATVYRTLKLFCEAGIANAMHFREGVTVYERQHAHHDHLICLGCGEIIEFRSDVIEREQTKIAEAQGYSLAKHRLHLFGHCQACQDKALEPG